jgi:glycine oxidase
MPAALTNRPVWDLAAETRLLDPGPGDLRGRYDVLVVGGGVVGLATAALCRRAGLGRVAVVERGRLASGPSGAGAGILAPALDRGTALADLAVLADLATLGRSSLALWRELDREWDGALGIESLDILQTLPPSAKESPGPERPPEAEVLGAEAARALEPCLGPGDAWVLLRDQARLHPVRLAGALARRAGVVATGVRAVGIQTAGSGCVRVRTDRGDLDAGAVVLATGSAPAIQGLPAPAAQLQVKGTMIATAPAPLRLGVGVAARGGLVFQTSDGRLVFGNTFDPTDGSPEVRRQALASTRADLEALIPDAAGLPLSHAWTCFRPATSGGLPVIDRVQGLEQVWATYGHFRTGFLMAAATGQALATWISESRRPEEIAAFGAPG